MHERSIQILRDAGSLLAEHGWCQDELRNEQGQMCTLGALRVATARGDLRCTSVVSGCDHYDFMKAYRAVQAAYDENDYDFPPSVTTWNDREGRTVEDVQLAFKQAIEILEKEDA